MLSRHGKNCILQKTKNCILHGWKSKGKQNMSIFQNGLINSQFAKICFICCRDDSSGNEHVQQSTFETWKHHEKKRKKEEAKCDLIKVGFLILYLCDIFLLSHQNI